MILYGSKSLTLRKSNENKFLILERKKLQKIFGSVKYDITGERRRIKNKEIREMFKENYIVETIMLDMTCNEPELSTKNGIVTKSSMKKTLRMAKIEMGKYS